MLFVLDPVHTFICGMHIHVCICIYVCVYTRICLYVCMHVYMCTHTYFRYQELTNQLQPYHET